MKNLKILNINYLKMKKFNLIKLIILLYVFVPYYNAMSYEEAIYKVIKKNKVYEIRKYSDRLAVETFEEGKNDNFRKHKIKNC